MNLDDSLNEDLQKTIDIAHNEYPNASIYLRTLDEFIAGIYYYFCSDVESEFAVYNELEKFVEKYSNHDMQYYKEMKV